MAKQAQYIFGRQHNVSLGKGTNHSHQDMELVYHYSGSGTVRSDDFGQIFFQPGDVQMMPRRQTHQQHQHQVGLDYCILFEADQSIRKRMNHACCYTLSQEAYPATELAALATIPKPQNQIEQTISNY